MPVALVLVDAEYLNAYPDIAVAEVACPDNPKNTEASTLYDKFTVGADVNPTAEGMVVDQVVL